MTVESEMGAAPAGVGFQVAPDLAHHDVDAFAGLCAAAECVPVHAAAPLAALRHQVEQALHEVVGRSVEACPRPHAALPAGMCGWGRWQCSNGRGAYKHRLGAACMAGARAVCVKFCTVRKVLFTAAWKLQHDAACVAFITLLEF